MAAGRPGTRGKPAVLDRIGLRVRLGAWIAATGLFLVAVYPWSAEFNHPEGNWIPGPLWLFIGTTAWDKLIGLVVAAVLAPSIFAILLKPGRWTALVSIVGLIAWIGFGWFLAAMASA